MSSNYVHQFRDKILGFESEFSMEFKDKELLFGALDHAYSPETKKQYALAGDALLDYFLFDYLIRKRGYSKGDMDDLRQDLNADNKLADIGMKTSSN